MATVNNLQELDQIHVDQPFGYVKDPVLWFGPQQDKIFHEEARSYLENDPFRDPDIPSWVNCDLVTQPERIEQLRRRPGTKNEGFNIVALRATKYVSKIYDGRTAFAKYSFDVVSNLSDYSGISCYGREYQEEILRLLPILNSATVVKQNINHLRCIQTDDLSVKCRQMPPTFVIFLAMKSGWKTVGDWVLFGATMPNPQIPSVRNLYPHNLQQMCEFAKRSQYTYEKRSNPWYFYTYDQVVQEGGVSDDGVVDDNVWITVPALKYLWCFRDWRSELMEETGEEIQELKYRMGNHPLAFDPEQGDGSIWPSDKGSDANMQSCRHENNFNSCVGEDDTVTVRPGGRLYDPVTLCWVNSYMTDEIPQGMILYLPISGNFDKNVLGISDGGWNVPDHVCVDSADRPDGLCRLTPSAFPIAVYAVGEKNHDQGQQLRQGTSSSFFKGRMRDSVCDMSRMMIDSRLETVDKDKKMKYSLKYDYENIPLLQSLYWYQMVKSFRYHLVTPDSHVRWMEKRFAQIGETRAGKQYSISECATRRPIVPMRKPSNWYAADQKLVEQIDGVEHEAYVGVPHRGTFYQCEIKSGMRRTFEETSFRIDCRSDVVKETAQSHWIKKSELRKIKDDVLKGGMFTRILDAKRAAKIDRVLQQREIMLQEPYNPDCFIQKTQYNIISKAAVRCVAFIMVALAPPQVVSAFEKYYTPAEVEYYEIIAVAYNEASGCEDMEATLNKLYIHCDRTKRQERSLIAKYENLIKKLNETGVSPLPGCDTVEKIERVGNIDINSMFLEARVRCECLLNRFLSNTQGLIDRFGDAADLKKYSVAISEERPSIKLAADTMSLVETFIRSAVSSARMAYPGVEGSKLAATVVEEEYDKFVERLRRKRLESGLQVRSVPADSLCLLHAMDGRAAFDKYGELDVNKYRAKVWTKACNVTQEFWKYDSTVTVEGVKVAFSPALKAFVDPITGKVDGSKIADAIEFTMNFHRENPSASQDEMWDGFYVYAQGFMDLREMVPAVFMEWIQLIQTLNTDAQLFTNELIGDTSQQRWFNHEVPTNYEVPTGTQKVLQLRDLVAKACRASEGPVLAIGDIVRSKVDLRVPDECLHRTGTEAPNELFSVVPPFSVEADDPNGGVHLGVINEMVDSLDLSDEELRERRKKQLALTDHIVIALEDRVRLPEVLPMADMPVVHYTPSLMPAAKRVAYSPDPNELQCAQWTPPSVGNALSPQVPQEILDKYKFIDESQSSFGPRTFATFVTKSPTIFPPRYFENEGTVHVPTEHEPYAQQILSAPSTAKDTEEYFSVDENFQTPPSKSGSGGKRKLAMHLTHSLDHRRSRNDPDSPRKIQFDDPVDREVSVSRSLPSTCVLEEADEGTQPAFDPDDSLEERCKRGRKMAIPPSGYGSVVIESVVPNVLLPTFSEIRDAIEKTVGQNIQVVEIRMHSVDDQSVNIAIARLDSPCISEEIQKWERSVVGDVLVVLRPPWAKYDGVALGRSEIFKTSAISSPAASSQEISLQEVCDQTISAEELRSQRSDSPPISSSSSGPKSLTPEKEALYHQAVEQSIERLKKDLRVEGEHTALIMAEVNFDDTLRYLGKGALAQSELTKLRNRFRKTLRAYQGQIIAESSGDPVATTRLASTSNQVPTVVLVATPVDPKVSEGPIQYPSVSPPITPELLKTKRDHRFSSMLPPTEISFPDISPPPSPNLPRVAPTTLPAPVTGQPKPADVVVDVGAIREQIRESSAYPGLNQDSAREEVSQKPEKPVQEPTTVQEPTIVQEPIQKDRKNDDEVGAMRTGNLDATSEEIYWFLDHKYNREVAELYYWYGWSFWLDLDEFGVKKLLQLSRMDGASQVQLEAVREAVRRKWRDEMISKGSTPVVSPDGDFKVPKPISSQKSKSRGRSEATEKSSRKKSRSSTGSQKPSPEIRAQKRVPSRDPREKRDAYCTPLEGQKPSERSSRLLKEMPLQEEHRKQRDVAPQPSVQQCDQYASSPRESQPDDGWGKWAPKDKDYWDDWTEVKGKNQTKKSTGQDPKEKDVPDWTCLDGVFIDWNGGFHPVGNNLGADAFGWIVQQIATPCVQKCMLDGDNVLPVIAFSFTESSPRVHELLETVIVPELKKAIRGPRGEWAVISDFDQARKHDTVGYDVQRRALQKYGFDRLRLNEKSENPFWDIDGDKISPQLNSMDYLGSKTILYCKAALEDAQVRILYVCPPTRSRKENGTQARVVGQYPYTHCDVSADHRGPGMFTSIESAYAHLKKEIGAEDARRVAHQIRGFAQFRFVAVCPNKYYLNRSVCFTSCHAHTQSGRTVNVDTATGTVKRQSRIGNNRKNSVLRQVMAGKMYHDPVAYKRESWDYIEDLSGYSHGSFGDFNVGIERMLLGGYDCQGRTIVPFFKGAIPYDNADCDRMHGCHLVKREISDVVKVSEMTLNQQGPNGEPTWYIQMVDPNDLVCPDIDLSHRPKRAIEFIKSYVIDKSTSCEIPYAGMLFKPGGQHFPVVCRVKLNFPSLKLRDRMDNWRDLRATVSRYEMRFDITDAQVDKSAELRMPNPRPLPWMASDKDKWIQQMAINPRKSHLVRHEGRAVWEAYWELTGRWK